MPSKSLKQRNLIFAIRNKYKSKKNTPKKWKWVWGEEWTKIKESYVKKFSDFLIENQEHLYNEINDYDVNKIIDITPESYDRIGILLDEALQDGKIEYNLCSWNFADEDDIITKDIIKIIDNVKDVYVLVIELEDEWFVIEVVSDTFGTAFGGNSTYFLCDQLQGLEEFIEYNFYI